MSSEETQFHEHACRFLHNLLNPVGISYMPHSQIKVALRTIVAKAKDSM